MKLEGRSLKRDFVRFVIPSIIAQWVFSLYTMIDGLFVAWGVSETALAAVNLALPFTTGMFALSLTFAVGTSTIVALLYGQKKYKRANEVFTQNVVILTALSLIISGVVLLNLERFCSFLGATPHLMPYVKEYIMTIAPFAVCFILSYTFEILISTDGYPLMATVIVSTGAVTNCILDYLFIMVFDKGVFGAAFATGMSQVMVIVLYLKHFLGKKGTIKFTKFSFSWELILREVKDGLPAGITELSSGIAIFIFNQAIIRFLSEDALVTYTVISYVNTLAIVSMVGISQGSQPLISYYYGRREPEKYKKLFRYELAATGVISVMGLVICIVGAEGIVSLFVDRQLTELKVYSVRALRIYSISILAAGYNVVISGYLTALERPGKAVVISVGRAAVMLVISMVILLCLFGTESIWWTPTLSEVVCLIGAMIVVKKSR